MYDKIDSGETVWSIGPAALNGIPTLTVSSHGYTDASSIDSAGADWGFRRRRILIPKAMRTAFRAEGEQFSERSDAGLSIVPELFALVKKNVSGAYAKAQCRWRRKGCGERGASPCPRPEH